MATALLCLIFLFVFLLVPRALQVSKQTMHSDFAGLLVQQELSDLRSADGKQLQPGNWHDTHRPGPDGLDFHLTSKLATVSPWSFAELRALRVEVDWTYRNQKFHQLHQIEVAGMGYESN